MDDMILTLVLLAGLQVKHLLADFVLQTSFMLAGKGRYGHIGGLSHAALHGVLSLPILLLAAGVFAGPSLGLVLLIVLVEVLVHYHLDWAKERWVRYHAVTSSHPGFWRAIGIDQSLHQLTYLMMVAAMLSGSAD